MKVSINILQYTSVLLIFIFPELGVAELSMVLSEGKHRQEQTYVISPFHYID